MMTIRHSPFGLPLAALCLIAVPAISLGQSAPNVVWMRGGSHLSSSHGVAFTPDGSKFAATNGWGSVKLWRWSDRMLLRTFRMPEPARPVWSLAVSADMIAAGDDQGRVVVWAVNGYAPKFVLNAGPNIAVKLAFSPNGQMLATGALQGTLKVWRMSDGSNVWTADAVPEDPPNVTNRQLFGLAFFPDGAKLMTVGQRPYGWPLGTQSRRTVWRVSDGAVLRDSWTIRSTDSTSYFWSLAISPTGLTYAVNQRIYSASDDHIIVGMAPPPGYASITTDGIVFTPDGQSIAHIGTNGPLDNCVALYDLGTGDCTRWFGISSIGIPLIAVSPDGGSVLVGADESVAAWNLADGSVRFKDPDAISGTAASVAISPDGTYVAAGGQFDQTVRFWRLSDGAPLGRFDMGYPVDRVRYTPDGATLVVGSGGGYTTDGIRLYRVSDMTLLRELTGAAGYYEATVSPNGTMVAARYRWGATVWKVSDGTQIVTTSSNQVCLGIDFSSDSGSLFVADGLGTTRYHLPDGVQMARRGVPGPPVAASPDGKMLAGGSPISVWNLASGNVSDPYGGGANYVCSLVRFSPCSNVFSTAVTNLGQVHMVNPKTGLLRMAYDQEAGVSNDGGSWVTDFAYSPGGQFFAYSRADSTVVLAKDPFWTKPRPSVVGVTPAAIVGGNVAVGTVTLDCPGEIGDTLVSLTSSNPAVLSVQSSVVVPVGKFSATFVATTFPVAASQPVIVTATANGGKKTKTVTVIPPSLNAVNLETGSVIGGTDVHAWAILNGTAAVPTTVTLTSANPAAHPPASVVVPAGSSSAPFTIATDPVPANTAGSITARLGTVTKAAALTVKPPAYASFTLAPNPVKGGIDVTGTVTMTGPVAANTTVNLTNLNTKATLPSPSVVIPAGANHVDFTITTTATTKIVSGAVKATVGTATKSVTLKVTP